jgi:hypothetical protein
MQFKNVDDTYDFPLNIYNAKNRKDAELAAEKMFKIRNWLNKNVIGYRILIECNQRELPSLRAVEAAYYNQPFNDILYGDTSRPLNQDEIRSSLKVAYEVDF